MKVAKKETTVDVLARMVQDGFKSIEERMDGIEERMATKDDLRKLGEDLGSKLGIHSRYWDEEQEKTFVTLKDHDLRINKLEDRVVVGKHAVKR